MNTLLQVSEWTSVSGKSYCNIPLILKYENSWKAFEMIWNKSPLEFMLFIKKEYNATLQLLKNEDQSIKSYLFSFDAQQDCHKFLLNTNQRIRKNNFTVETFLNF